MPRSLCTAILSLIALGLTAPTTASAQAQAAPPPGAGGGAPAAGPEIPGLNDVLATVTVGNQTEKVTKGDLLELLSHYPIPEDDHEATYRQAIDTLLNTKLLLMFLARQKVTVPPERVDDELERLKQSLKNQGQNFEIALLQSKKGIDDIRKTLEERARFAEYIRTRATEAELRKFVANHRDLFRGTQVRASHILISLGPNASETDKEKARQKLANIKAEIEKGTISFAAAANKYSDDPANAGGAGGDLDYFTLNTGIIEEFTNVAFKLKKGMISDPVETSFGFHLIQVTDRKEGKDPDFEQNKVYITNQFAADLQKEIVSAEKKQAKIDIKPMPKDLFPPTAPANAPATEPEKSKAGTSEPATPKAP
jgi:peptidyl-prolyl cis-trans isomerase C